MAADSYDITIDQGADWYWTVRWKLGNSERTAKPKNVTGYTVRLVIADDYNATVYRLQLTTANGGAVVVGTDGSFQFHATASQTNALQPRKYKYEVLATSPTNVVTKLARGICTVRPGV